MAENIVYEENFLRMLAEYKWPNGFVCPKPTCRNNKAKNSAAFGRVLKCSLSKCNGEESITAHTVFDRSKVNLNSAYKLIAFLVDFCKEDLEEKVVEIGDDEKKEILRTIKKADIRDSVNTGTYVSIMELARKVYDEMSDARFIINGASQKLKSLQINFSKLTTPTVKEIREYETEKARLTKLISSNNEKINIADNFIYSKVQEYHSYITPTLEDLHKIFDMDTQNIQLLLSKISDRMKILKPNLEVESVFDYFKEGKYDLDFLMGLFMFRMDNKWENGESCIEGKWYKLKKPNPWKSNWTTIQTVFERNDEEGSYKRYYNKPGEPEFLYNESDPDPNDGIARWIIYTSG